MSAGFDTRYAEYTPRSRELFERASEIIPGGAGSSARTVTFGWKPYPPFIAGGSGARMRDVDGNEYIDYLLGLGPDILGHRHPAVTAAVALAIPSTAPRSACRTSWRSRRHARWSTRSRASTWCASRIQAARRWARPCASPEPSPNATSSCASRATTTAGRTWCTGATIGPVGRGTGVTSRAGRGRARDARPRSPTPW